MALRFTYGGDPSVSSRDAVRFTAGDTVKEVAVFDDREIDYQLSETPNVRLAAAAMLEAKAAEYSRKGYITVGDVAKDYSKAAEAMLATATRIRNQALSRALPFFGGLTKSGKEELAQDADAVQPNFFIGETDNPEAVQLNGQLLDDEV